MLTDEKIANVKKQNRNKKKAERERVTYPDTAQQVSEKMDQGYLVLPGHVIKVSMRTYLNDVISAPHLDQFYDREILEHEKIILKHDRYKFHFSFALEEKGERLMIEEWCRQIAELHYKKMMVLEFIKAEALPDRDYVCYKSNVAGREKVHFCFLIYGNRQQITGMGECLEEQSNTLGVLLEAMIIKMKINSEQEGTDGDSNHL